jgi:hypothetical protein
MGGNIETACTGQGKSSGRRNPWNRSIARPRSAATTRTSRGEPANWSRSVSNISTLSKCAAAITCSFSLRIPDNETVAMA